MRAGGISAPFPVLPIPHAPEDGRGASTDPVGMPSGRHVVCLNVLACYLPTIDKLHTLLHPGVKPLCAN